LYRDELTAGGWLGAQLFQFSPKETKKFRPTTTDRLHQQQQSVGYGCCRHESPTEMDWWLAAASLIDTKVLTWAADGDDFIFNRIHLSPRRNVTIGPLAHNTKADRPVTPLAAAYSLPQKRMKLKMSDRLRSAAYPLSPVLLQQKASQPENTAKSNAAGPQLLPPSAYKPHQSGHIRHIPAAAKDKL